MNRYLTLSAVAIFLLCISTNVNSQNTDDYRSAATGNWNVAATWERYDGANWVAAPAAPTSTDGVITIRNTHNVTVNAVVTADQIVVDAGGTLTLASTLTLANGTGTDLVVNGSMIFSSGTLGGTGTVTIEAPGTLTLNSAGSKTFNAALTIIGTMIWNDGTIGGTGAIVNNGTLTMNGDDVLNNSSTFTNTGTMTKQTGIGTTTISPNSWSNSGTININSGTLTSGITFTNTGSVNMSNATWINNSTFNHNTGSQINGSGNFENVGTLTLNVTQVFPASLVLHSTGAINGAGNLTINNDFTIEGNITGTGTLTINANTTWLNGLLGRALTIANGQTLTLNTAGAKTMNAALTINGTMVWNDGTIGGSGAIINNGTMTMNGDDVLNNSSTFTNAGTMTKQTGTGTTTISPNSWSNSGTININSGTLTNGITFTNTGSINMNNTTWINNSTFNHNTGSQISGSGNFNNAGTLTLNISQVFAASLVFSNTATINGAGNLTINNDFTIEGNITGTGTLTINANTTWLNGTLGRALTITAIQTLTLNTAGAKTMNAALTINGTMIWNDGTIGGSGAIVNNGTMTMNGDDVLNNSSTFTNTGTMTKQTGTGTTTISPNSWSNSGTININSGTLTNGITFTNTGSINMNNTTWINNSTFNHNTGSQISGSGNFNNAGTLTLNISQVFAASLVFSSTATINGAGNLTINNDFTIEGNITGTGSLTINANTTWLNGLLGRALTIANGQTLILNTAGAKTMNAALTINGTMIWNDGTIGGSGAIVNNGTMTMNGDDVLNNSSTFTNTGTMTKQTGVGTTTISPNSWSNSGTININGGILTSGITFTNEQTGIIKGTGILLVISTFTNNGTIAPGLSPGILTVNGTNPFGANSKLNIEIAGNGGAGQPTGHDQLQRAENLTLNGTLNVIETGTVPDGDYTIISLSSGTIIGTFSSTNLPANYSVIYNSNNVAVRKGAISTWYRDFDGDGYGDPNNSIQAAQQPAGYVVNNSDCNDNNAAINPNTIWYLDADNDNYYTGSGVTQCTSPGVGYKMSGLTGGGDCNDNNINVHPGATEVCNNIDDDCDGQIDEGVKTTFYQDADGDGFGNPSVTQQACSVPQGYVANNTDCNDANSAINPNTIWYLDADNDNYYTGSGITQCASPGAGYKMSGLTAGGDCNDNNVNIHPGTTEICNNIDDDCDGQTDEGAQPVTWYQDADGDGFGNLAVTQQSCTQPGGYVLNNTDCNDNNVNVHPGATEICNGTDDDCDGQTDEGVPTTTFYRDIDGDGFGSAASGTILACSTPQGYVLNNIDCNDNNVNIHPGATEVCNGIDDDCDGQTDEGVATTFYRDLDGDGFGSAVSGTTQACSVPQGYVTNNADCNDANAAINPNTIWYLDADNDNYYTGSGITQCASPGAGYKMSGLTAGGDCNDNNVNIHPGATEICNNTDDDCDGQTDEGAQPVTWYQDADGDGFGNSSVNQQSCTQPQGYVLNNTDCDDTNNAINPNTIWYLDADNDNYYTGSGVTQCTSPGAGYRRTGLTGSGDCNDNNTAIHPNATEVCNNIDDDCDGQVDEGVKTIFYQDADGDGFGNPSVTQQACSVPQGYVANNTDCNDANSAINPNTIWYLDADNDNYYTGSGVTQCTSPGAGYKMSGLTAGGDCNDNNVNVHPGATEICNNVDDDCDGQTDEGAQPVTWYLDADNDNYYTGSGVTQCTNPGAGYKTSGLTAGGDCNDNNAAIHPNAIEICNNTDDDCDGQIDEGAQPVTWYQDADGDGFGNASVSQSSCSQPAGYVLNNTDCNDTNNAINPNTVWYLDADNDNYYTGSGLTQCTSPGAGYRRTGLTGGSDCNDNNASVHPNATETCNNVDDDCDGQIDEGIINTFYRDADGDGFGSAASGTTQACSAPQGYVANNTDCNDNNATVHPGAVEICGNNIDDNCNQQIDENCTTDLPVITLRTYPVKEGDAGTTVLDVEVKLDRPALLQVRVTYATSNDDANAGLDYVATQGVLIIPVGAVSGIVRVSIIGDLIRENNERFWLNFGNPINVIIEGDGRSRIMIIDDDKGKPNVRAENDIQREQLPGLNIPNIIPRNHIWAITGISEMPNDVTIMNMQGQVIFRANNYKNNIPIGNVSVGLYVYQIRVMEKDKKVKFYTGKLLVTE